MLENKTILQFSFGETVKKQLISFEKNTHTYNARHLASNRMSIRNRNCNCNQINSLMCAHMKETTGMVLFKWRSGSLGILFFHSLSLFTRIFIYSIIKSFSLLLLLHFLIVLWFINGCTELLKCIVKNVYSANFN